MQGINQALIEKPSIEQVLAIERKLRGDRLEIFQEAFDVLHKEKQTAMDPDIAWRIRNLKNLMRGFKRVNREARDNRSRPAGLLRIKFLSPEGELELGLASVNLVTNAGVAYVIDALQAAATIENLKYHASGTGGTAEDVGDTALVTEVDTRVAGTQIEGSSANIYKTVATLTYSVARSIVEQGVLSASSAGTLFDRSVFTSIPGDTDASIIFTFEWTLNAGG